MSDWQSPLNADWRNINLANWESRVPLHTGPTGYPLGSFDDPDFLSPQVRFDLPKLGRLDGLDIVHLQCHIGTDTVSLSRLRPRSTAGLDFSPAALRAARELAVRARADIAFVEADVYDAVQALGADRFDLVYTGIGALCWIPSIRRWADVVASLLRPGGRLFMREYHPVLWSLSEPRPDGVLVVEYPYFETDGTLFVEHDTYAGTGAVASPRMVHFNHGLAEVFTTLTDAGLSVTTFEEHREAPWNPLGEVMMPSPHFAAEFILAKDRDRIPLTYSLQAVKR
jgi:SAM-dependent methyltransferase